MLQNHNKWGQMFSFQCIRCIHEFASTACSTLNNKCNESDVSFICIEIQKLPLYYLCDDRTFYIMLCEI